MRATFLLTLVLCAGVAVSQEGPAPLTKGSKEITLFASGGVGTPPGDAGGTGMLSAGFRYGKVVSHERGSGWYRGNLELVIDAIPVYVFSKDRTVYGAGISPLVSKWNFTSPKKVKPFVELASGVIFTNGDIPGGTNPINFSSGIGFGLQYFTGQQRSVAFSTRFSHISNAGLDKRNPAINVVQFSVSYQFWK